MNDFGKLFAKEVIGFLKSDLDNFESDIDSCAGEYVLSYMQDMSMQTKNAYEAIEYLCEHDIETYEQCLTFEEKFGSIPSIDCSLESLLGFGWQEKSGKIVLEGI